MSGVLEPIPSSVPLYYKLPHHAKKYPKYEKIMQKRTKNVKNTQHLKKYQN